MKSETATITKTIKHKGGRPPKTIVRNELIAVRLFPAEKKEIEAKAKKAGINPSEWFRIAAKKAKVVPRLSADETQYLRMLSGMANNLNQLTKLAHTKGLQYMAQACIMLLEKLSAIIEKLFKDGREAD
jgi:Bacterial mobilisation protein (MobC)